MEERSSIKKEISIVVPPEIYTNKELSISEKLLLALDYSYNNKKGYTKLSNKWIGKILNQHQNTVGKNRKSLVEKGYLEKDSMDKRKYLLITEKLNNVEIPSIEGKIDKRKLILPFEIYNHPNLTDGAKLFWGNVNSFRESKNGYYEQRTKAKIRFDVSEDTITNWTNELQRNDLLEEYHIKFNERDATKYRTMRTKDLSDLDLLNGNTYNIVKNTTIERKPIIEREEYVFEPLGAIDISELYSEKPNEKDFFNNNDFNKNIEKKGGVKGYSQLGIKEKKYNDDDFENYEEDEDEDF